MRIDLDEAYMQMAEIWSKRSHARRKKVGCLIVKDRQIISDGYNGTPAGFGNSCEDEHQDGSLITKKIVLHAELNALMKIARSTQSSTDATMYLTLSPCHDCAKLIIQSGINRVVFREQYRDPAGVELLQQAKIQVEKIK